MRKRRRDGSRARFAGDAAAISSSQKLIRAQRYPGVVHSSHVPAVAGLRQGSELPLVMAATFLGVTGFDVLAAARQLWEDR